MFWDVVEVVEVVLDGAEREPVVLSGTAAVDGGLALELLVGPHCTEVVAVEVFQSSSSWALPPREGQDL